MFKFRINKGLVTVAALGLGAGAALVVGLVVGLAIGMAVTAFAALIAMLLWNFAAPLIPFVPVEYQSVSFMMTWGVVIVLALVRGLVFGGRN